MFRLISGSGCKSLSSPRKTRGFSMMEMAIVVGVAGLVIGSIWGAARYVREAVRREQALEQVTAVVTQMRFFYQGLAGIEFINDADAMNARLLGRAIIPNDMYTAAAARVDHALAGLDVAWAFAGHSFTVLNATSAGEIASNAGASDRQMFLIAFAGLSQPNCAYLIQQLSSGKGPSGLRRIIHGDGALPGGPAPAQEITEFPVGFSAAMQICDSPPMNLAFAYPLRIR